jgi:magnesium chelatase subunit D
MFKEHNTKELDEPNHIKQEHQNNEVLNIKEEVFGVDTKVSTNKLIEKKRILKDINASGQRLQHPTHDKKGKYIGGHKPKDFDFNSSSDIAVLETINKAVLASENKNALKNGEKLEIKNEHIHFKKRVGKSSYLFIFCVDASGSMGANERMKVVKGVIFSLLHSNYIYRDKVSLVIFRGDDAEVILPPTRSTDLAFKLLKEIPTGGTTPLIKGLIKALDIALEEKRKKTGYLPLIILISDARGNVYYKDAIDDLLKTGKEISKNQIDMIIIDTENPEVKLEINKKLSEAAKAKYYHIDVIDQENIDEILEMEGIFENI